MNVNCHKNICEDGGHWDFRFCGFSFFLDRFFGSSKREVEINVSNTGVAPSLCIKTTDSPQLLDSLRQKFYRSKCHL